MHTLFFVFFWNFSLVLKLHCISAIQCINMQNLPNSLLMSLWQFDFICKTSKLAGGRRVFREFLRCEYSEENILFWLACEELKKVRKTDQQHGKKYGFTADF